MAISEDDLARLSERSARGNADATLTIAEHLRAEGGDLKRIEDLYLLAYDQGSGEAVLSLAYFYEHHLGNDLEAVRWYKIACHAGYGLACTCLALAYMDGSLSLPVDASLSTKYTKLASAASR